MSAFLLTPNITNIRINERNKALQWLREVFFKYFGLFRKFISKIWLFISGDFYITKHSNLAEVHAVFHLVTDDSVAAHTINSRHPIMTGVRNIMLAASRHSVTNLIVPLLLVHEMSEVKLSRFSRFLYPSLNLMGKIYIAWSCFIHFT